MPNGAHRWEFDKFGMLFDRMLSERMQTHTLRREKLSRTLKPAVVVGIGGSGCEVAARLKRKIHHFYRGMEEYADMIQFRCFDTMPISSHNDLVRQTLQEGVEYFHLGGFSGRDVVTAYKNDPDLQRWWDGGYPVGAMPIERGCERIRQLGRLCLWHNRKKVEAALSRAITNAYELDKHAVSEANLPSLDTAQPIEFYVISSSCGGTGSGMFLDMCFLLYRVAVISQGIPQPRITCFIIMPSLFIEGVEERIPVVMHAFQANAYAFFKELQHFSHHLGDFKDHCMNAIELQGDEAPFMDWKPGQLIYVLDRNVRPDKVITDLDSMFTLVADVVFHKILSSLFARPMDVMTPNIWEILADDHQGRARSFSSAGVSYVLYPFETIMRCATAAYMRDIVYQCLTRDLTDTDRVNAEQRAREIFETHAEILNVESVAGHMLGDVIERLQRDAPTSTWLNQQLRQGLDWFQLLENSERLINSLKAIAREQIRNAYNEHYGQWLQDAQELIVQEVNNCSGSECIKFAQAVLRELKRLVSSIDVPHSVLNVDEVNGRATQGRKEVMAKARRLIKRNIKHSMLDFLEANRQLAEHELREYVATLVTKYKGELIKLLEEAIERCDAIYRRLRDVGDALDDQADEYDPSVDQPYLTITTQLIPRGGVESAVKGAVDQLHQHLADDAREFLSTPPAPLWSLGATDEESSQKAVEEMLKDLLDVTMSRVMELLGRRIDEVALESLSHEAEQQGDTEPRRWARKQFEQILSNMNALAQPTWQLNLDRWQLRKGDLAEIVSVVKPQEMPNELLPEPLQDNPSPGSDNFVMILREEHGVPLHTMVPLMTLRSAYLTWVKDKNRAHRSPAHICKDWNEGKGLLEDIYPMEITAEAENVRYFALGMFTDWLLREQGVKVVEQLIEGHTGNGVVFRRGRNQYYAVIVEETREGTLRKVEERRLCPSGKRNRVEACKNFDRECVASVKAYMDRLENSIAWEQLERHINRYIVWLRQQINDGRIPHEQGEAEIRALEQYMEE